jgi:hypothetical protein
MSTLGDGPIEQRYRAMMNALAEGLDDALNPGLSGKERKVGFVLLVFDYGEPSRANYISNGADRKDIVVMMKEQIARFEGQPEVQGRA